MRLNDVAMIAADTIRSRAYLQALLRNNLLPNAVLILKNIANQTLPGQLPKNYTNELDIPETESSDLWSEIYFDPTEAVEITLSKSGIPYENLDSNNINDPLTVAAIGGRIESVFIYSGFGGVLLREDILSTKKKFLHVHGGYLPDYKGSTTNYYSLIKENYIGASSIFMNNEIDSGPILYRSKFPVPVNRIAIDHIYDSAARAKILIETLLRYIEYGEWRMEPASNSEGVTYFIIHPVLKHIAILSK